MGMGGKRRSDRGNMKGIGEGREGRGGKGVRM